MGLNDEIEKAVNWETQSVGMDDSMRVAIEKMIANKCSALAVKLGDEVVGVLTDFDLMDCLDRDDDLDKIKASSCMTACELITGKHTGSPCAQLDSSQSVKNAIAVLNVAGVHHLLVSGDDDKCVGLISSLDLLKLAIS
jgi:CBS domain-containing protein